MLICLQRYQSIAARGERIEDVLAEAESFEGEIPNGAHSAPEQSAADAGDGAESLEDGEVASSEGLAGAEIHVSRLSASNRVTLLNEPRSRMERQPSLGLGRMQSHCLSINKVFHHYRRV